jgi:hypothetical protein
MIVVQLMGGLGNQMFQYSAARALTLSINDGLFYDFDDSYPLAAREISVHKFNISANPATREILKRIKPAKGFNRLIKKIFDDPDRYLYQEKEHYAYDPLFENINGDFYLRGFWQNLKYFEKIRSQLLIDFTISKESADYRNAQSYISKNSEIVSVHIRRGDYTNPNSNFSPLPFEYYFTAFQVINIIDKKIIYFTDDPLWVSKYFDLSNALIISDEFNLSDAEEIVLMSKCKYNIIANSTFSWWGAWLNQRSDRTVIYPKNWMTDERAIINDLFPDDWKAI